MTNESPSPDSMIRAVAVTHDRLFAGYATSPTLGQIWRHTYGDDDPEDGEPLGSVTLTT
jgi:hypothetical protein